MSLNASGELANPQNIYRTGDYWLIPARTAANGVIDWPATQDDAKKKVPVALPPHGVEHHCAPLGVISSQGDGTIKIEIPTLLPTLIPNLKNPT